MELNKPAANRTLSEINVTPLVDVMLVLLVIFMVTAPLIQHGVKVDLPKAQAGAMEPIQKEQLVVTIDSNKNIFILEDKYTYAEFTKKIKSIGQSKRDKKVFLSADGTLDYSIIMKVMAVIKNSGFEEIGLVTEPVLQPEELKDL
jgi:biopolymer transport protein TolR